MAGGAVVGALKVVLGADTAALDRGLKDAQSNLAKFGDSMGKVGAAAAAAFVGLGTALGIAVKGAINDADKLGKMAQSVGMSVEELSKLKYAADLSGVSLEQLGGALGKLTKNMAEAARDPASQVALAFKTIGVTATDARTGALKPLSQMVSELAGKFSGWNDSTAKSDAALAILGKTGRDLIPLLNSGAAGIAEMKKEAEELGIVIDTKTAKSAEAFNDNLTRLTAVKNGIVLLVTARLLPALESLSKQLVQGVKDSDGMKTASEGLIIVIKGIATAAISAWTSLKATSSVIAGVIAASILVAQGQMKAAFDALMHGGEDAASAVDDAGKLIEDVWKERIPAAAEQGAESVRKANAPIIGSAAELAKAAAQAEAALKKLYEQGKKTYEDVAPPAEKFRLEVEKLNAQYNAGAISAETYARAVDKIRWPSLTQAIQDAGNLQKQLDSFSTSSLNSTADALTDIVTGAKSAKEAFADLAKAVIRDLVAMTIKAILFKGIIAPLFGFSDGGSIITGGSGGLSFATGGSFTVPGGSSMTDNQMIPLHVASGERVTIDRPNSPASSSNKTLEVRGVRAKEFFRGDTLNALLENIQLAVNDGYKLKLAPVR